MSDVFKEIQELILNKESLVLSESTGVFCVNGQEIPTQDALAGHVAEGLYNLRMGSLELGTGLSLEEFSCFIELLNNAQHLEGEEQIKQYLKEKGFMHIIPRFATYKLVEEDEAIVKEEGSLKIDELPASIVDTFLDDLNKGNVGKQLSVRDKVYRVLAHNPEFLAKVVFDLTKDKDSHEELVKILWLIGDYLLDEISTAREEELNRKILNELKERLLSLYGQKQEKAHWKEEIQKIFTAINAALLLKGFIVLYKKHKRELENVADKISEILKTIPTESQLYRKTKEDLEKIGMPLLDPAIFKSESSS
jgi:hypothetical protein